MKKTKYRIWNIFYPILLYYTISAIVFFALTMIVGSNQELYMLKQMLSSGAVIPFLLSAWKQDCYAKTVVFGKQKEGVLEQVKQIFLSCVAVACFGMALNNLIAMTPLMQVSSGFQEANENFFAGTILMEILASCVIVPIAEELLFRGVVLNRCSILVGEKAGIVFSALLFGLIHVNLVQFLYAGLLGIVLGMIVQKTGKVSLAVWGHGAANLLAIIRAETGVFDFSYQPNLPGIGFSVLLLGVGVLAGMILLKKNE